MRVQNIVSSNYVPALFIIGLAGGFIIFVTGVGSTTDSPANFTLAWYGVAVAVTTLHLSGARIYLDHLGTEKFAGQLIFGISLTVELLFLVPLLLNLLLTAKWHQDLTSISLLIIIYVVAGLAITVAALRGRTRQ